MSRLKQGFAGRSFKGGRDRPVGVELPLVERLIDYRNFRTNCPKIRRPSIGDRGVLMMPMGLASPPSRQFLDFLSINSHGQYCTGWPSDRRLSAPRLKGGQVAHPLASRRAQVVQSMDGQDRQHRLIISAKEHPFRKSDRTPEPVSPLSSGRCSPMDKRRSPQPCPSRQATRRDHLGARPVRGRTIDDHHRTRCT
jgi:hypothetical protein